MRAREFIIENSGEDATRAEAQAAYMQGECMILAVAINQLNPKRYPIGYIWEYNISPGAPDIQLDDDEWDDLSPEEQEEVSKDISRHSVVHAYVRDRETNEYIDARGRHKELPNLWGRLGQTRFEEFPGSARELIDITVHGDWDEVGEQVSFKRGQPAFDSLAGPAGIKRAQDYAVKYLGVEASKNKAPGTDQQGVAEGLLNEYRDRLLQYVKNLLPTWPEYVLKDWLVPNKGDLSNLPDTELKNGIMEKLKGAGLTSNSKWQLVPDMKFTMDMFDPKTKQLLAGRAGGTSDLGMGIPKDKERHATQAALAQQQGGVRKEPVLLIKTAKGYELLEGWHRTIQHFVKYPDGYTGPAYVAVAQGQQGVSENFADGKVKGKGRPGLSWSIPRWH